MIERVLIAAAVTVALSTLSAAVPPQANGPTGASPNSNAAHAVIHTQSNLVLVPAFIYKKDRIGWISSQDMNCMRADRDAFLRSLSSEVYLAADCDSAEIRDLSDGDFHLFDDGVQQKIEAVSRERWWVSVRDNMSWHVESSDTASGMWSSTDLGGRNLLPDVRGFYILAYVPPSSGGGCHRIRIEVNRGGSRVFARDEYCGGQTANDTLYGDKLDSRLENNLLSTKEGRIPLSLQAGVFHYASNNTGRVDVVLEFPWEQLSHEWISSNWSLRARISVLGVVRERDGSVVSRFSDLLYPPYWPAFIEGQQSWLHPPLYLGNVPDAPPTLPRLGRWDPGWLPSRYETQLQLAPGEYRLGVVLSDGEKFGRAEIPLTIDNYDGKDLALSSIVFCNRFRDAHVAEVEARAANFAPQYVPLVSKGIQVTPTGDTRFRKGEPLIPYFEVYEPLLETLSNTEVEAHIKIVNAGTGQVVKDFPAVDVATYEQPGSTAIHIAREIPFEQLQKGAYRLEVQATDSAGRSTPWRTAHFTVE